MTYSHFAFGHFDYRHLAGWHFHGGGGFLVFQGLGGAEAIDWETALAGVGGGCIQASMRLPLPPGQVQALGARRVSASGVLECSRGTYVLLRMDASGNLSGPLAPAQDLSVRSLSGGQLLLEFSYRPLTGYAPPTGFDILADAGNGTLDSQHPVTTVTAALGLTEYSCTIAPAARPTVLGVRPMSANLAGPTAFVSVPSSAPLQAPVIL
jgi:hypothetical protein